MYTLGINAVYHDSAACLVHDGQVVAASEEERFTHIKHAKRPVPFSTWELPFHAVDDCLRQAGITLADVDHFAYSYDPRRFSDTSGDEQITLPLQPSRHRAANGHDSPWDPLFLAHIINAPRHLASGAPASWARMAGQLTPDEVIQRWHFVEHHLCHEASAFLAAPFDDTAVLTIDGRGEKATTSLGEYWQGTYRRLKQICLPDSLGLLYEAVTQHLGFLHSSDEYKVMALASYGTPAYREQFRSIIAFDDDGNYRIAPTDLTAVFGPPRVPDSPLSQHHYDLAHSLQQRLEETALHLVGWLRSHTRSANLSMAGGVVLNCVMNARIRNAGHFEHVWAQPAAGDAGTALGAALWVDRQRRPESPGPGQAAPRWTMEHCYLGPSYDDDEIETFLKWMKVPYRHLRDVVEDTAQRLADDQIIGWFQGRMEFGPRALGARSILASPISPTMQARLNELKDREDFRPVAPVVLEECAQQWFSAQAGGNDPAPFMLFVFDVRPDKAARIPAVCHVDGTARVQTIRRDQHPRYYDLIKAFGELTGVPILVNTSFNTRGEPIVCTPRDAIESFWTSPLDALVIGSFVLEKPYGR